MDSLFHPFPNYLQMENRFRYRKIRVRLSRARIILQFEKDEDSSFASLSCRQEKGAETKISAPQPVKKQACAPRGCMKGPQPLHLQSAGGGVYPAEERFSVS